MVCPSQLIPARRFVVIGDGKVQQLNVNDYYELGKQIAAMEKQINSLGNDGIATPTIAWPLFVLRWKFEHMLKEPCALLPSSQRSARAVMKSINALIPEEINEVFNLDKDAVLERYQLNSITTAFTNFETVLSNDMPEMSTFAVAQIGIFRTDDLINRAFRQIAEPLQSLLEDKAKADIVEAGKCLAFRLSTASGFHACRAIETGIDQYYEALVGTSYKVSTSGGNNNWGAKIGELEKNHADVKVTEFLTHIRKQYRNPVTHPEVVLDEREAVDLFVASLCAISMMLGAVKSVRDKPVPVAKLLPSNSPKKIGSGK